MPNQVEVPSLGGLEEDAHEVEAKLQQLRKNKGKLRSAAQTATVELHQVADSLVCSTVIDMCVYVGKKPIRLQHRYRREIPL